MFVGGWTLEAAEAVCNADNDLDLDVLDGIQSLVDKSLVRQQETGAGEPRFLLLETIREYALEALEASGNAEHTRRHHARYYRAYADFRPQEDGSRTSARLYRLDHAHNNLRAALQWATSRSDAETAVRLAARLKDFWHIRGHWSEGRAAIEADFAAGPTGGMR